MGSTMLGMHPCTHALRKCGFIMSLLYSKARSAGCPWSTGGVNTIRRIDGGIHFASLRFGRSPGTFISRMAGGQARAPPESSASAAIAWDLPAPAPGYRAPDRPGGWGSRATGPLASSSATRAGCYTGVLRAIRARRRNPIAMQVTLSRAAPASCNHTDFAFGPSDATTGCPGSPRWTVSKQPLR